MSKKKKDVADTLKEQGPEAVRAQVDDLERERREEAERKKEAAETLKELNRDNAVVLDGSRVLVLRFERDKRDIGGESYVYNVPVFLHPADFRMLYLNRRIKSRDKYGKPIAMDIGRWWLGNSERRQYRGVAFVPAGPAVIDGKLNLWRGWGIEPKQGDWSLMRRHILEVLAAGNKAVDAYTIKWLAWLFQHPDQQAEAAPTFLSDGRGTGKGTLGRGLCRIFGQHGIHISSPDQLTGKFNDHLRQCCFLFADEAYGPKDKSTEGQLKRLVTEDTIHIEPKGRGQFDVPNCLHIMFASNLDWVVPAGPHERRWVVQRVSEIHRQEEAWFKPLYAEVKAGGLAAMLYDLLRVDLGDWHPRQIVKTDALAEQQEESLSPLDAWWVNILHNGELVGSVKNFPERAVTNTWDEDIEEVQSNSKGDDNSRFRTIRHEGLFASARASSPKLRGWSDHAIATYLKSKGAIPRRVDRKRGWWFPSLSVCRDQWCLTYPATDWSGDDTSDWQERAEWDDRVRRIRRAPKIRATRTTDDED